MKLKMIVLPFLIITQSCYQDLSGFGLALFLDRLNLEVWKQAGTLLGIKPKSKQDVHFRGIGETRAPAGESKSQVDIVSLNDVVGVDAVLIEVRETVDFLKHPERYRKLGAQLPRGILLEGPPGNGKTMIARAIAQEADCNFLYASASSFVEMYVGVGAARIRELFEKAKKSSKPTIIFIDELDAIGAVERGAGGNEEYRQTLNQLLTELDGFDARNNIVVIAATNFAASLDKALTRAGRFDRLVKVPLPDETARLQILQHYMNKLPAKDISQQELALLAQETEGFCGADLKTLVNEAALHAVRENAPIVKACHIKQACDKIMQSRFSKRKNSANFNSLFMGSE